MIQAANTNIFNESRGLKKGITLSIFSSNYKLNTSQMIISGIRYFSATSIINMPNNDNTSNNDTSNEELLEQNKEKVLDDLDDYMEDVEGLITERNLSNIQANSLRMEHGRTMDRVNHLRDQMDNLDPRDETSVERSNHLLEEIHEELEAHITRYWTLLPDPSDINIGHVIAEQEYDNNSHGSDTDKEVVASSSTKRARDEEVVASSSTKRVRGEEVVASSSKIDGDNSPQPSFDDNASDASSYVKSPGSTNSGNSARVVSSDPSFSTNNLSSLGHDFTNGYLFKSKLNVFLFGRNENNENKNSSGVIDFIIETQSCELYNYFDDIDW